MYTYSVVNAQRKSVIFCLFHSWCVFDSNPRTQRVVFCNKRTSNNQQMIIIVINIFKLFVDPNGIHYERQYVYFVNDIRPNGLCLNYEGVEEKDDRRRPSLSPLLHLPFVCRLPSEDTALSVALKR